MPSLLTKLLLFLSSYSPLFVILAIQHYSNAKWISIIFVGIAIISVFAIRIYFRIAAHWNPHIITASEIKSRDGEAMSYIITYLVPFLKINFSECSNAISLGLLLIVLAVLYTNSNMIYTNPILNMMRYHIFEVKCDDGKVIALICKRTYLQPGSQIHVVPIGDYISMEKSL